jgi:chorismate-pyruvate lyase
MQDRRPPDVREVAPGSLDPAMRFHLFSDGLVTRAVEARTLRRVTTRVVDQRPAAMPDEVACALSIDAGACSLRRRVVMSLGGGPGRSRPFAYAESYHLPERLPGSFLDALASAGGIGHALQESCAESRRDLLWLGARLPPSWAGGLGDRECVVRTYRVVLDGRPAIHVLEGLRLSFAAPPGRAMSLRGARSRP